ncbi:MAG: septation protein SpoVG family protein [Candidatus Omnitrophica bacterium]|nr:septation protein SpoVG family protein [Candidatus Omnitrophota bacterium]
MEITEIRVFPKEGQDKKLKAYATVTFDHVFVVRNIKIIQGAAALFIAMPSRKVKNSCSKCGVKNEVGSRYCNHCAAAQPQNRNAETDPVDAKADHRDMAHPITQEFRDYLQKKILDAYTKEIASGRPVSKFDAGDD